MHIHKFAYSYCPATTHIHTQTNIRSEKSNIRREKSKIRREKPKILREKRHTHTQANTHTCTETATCLSTTQKINIFLRNSRSNIKQSKIMLKIKNYSLRERGAQLTAEIDVSLTSQRQFWKPAAF